MDVKLQQFVSDCGLMSRRAAEREIENGHFAINGVKAKDFPAMPGVFYTERKKKPVNSVPGR